MKSDANRRGGPDRRVARARRWAVVSLLCAVGLVVALRALLHAADPKPNIILIISDTTRADHLGCYGYARNTSPNIDRFARGGLLFENCSSHAPVTGSSHASILTGFYPHETKVYDNRSLSEDATSLPEILERNGYATMAVISNYVLRKGRRYEQGIEFYDDTMENLEIARDVPERRAPETARRAVELIDQVSEEPFFLWVLFQDPHGPYTPPDSLVEGFLPETTLRGAEGGIPPQRLLRVNSTVSGVGGIPSYQRFGDEFEYDQYVARYDAEIRFMDQHFQRILDALEKRGLLDRSIVLFTSDHGEGMGEHDYYFAHGEFLYQGLLHVPLVIRYGDRLRGRRSDPVQHVDIVPTLLEMAGVKTDIPFHGRDLRVEPEGTRNILSEMEMSLDGSGLRYSLVRGALKLVLVPAVNESSLFDLDSDPGEEVDLAADPDHQVDLRDMRKNLDRMIREDLLQLPEGPVPDRLTDEEEKRLKALGYTR